MRDNNNESNFSDVVITHVVAFECPKFEFEEKIDLLRKISFYDVIPSSVEQKHLNNKIFSEIFVERYPKILNVILEINFWNLINQIKITEKISKLKLINKVLNINEDFLSRDIRIKISFDQIGISSVRFDFKINNQINTSHLIKNANDTSCLVDEILFPELENKFFEILEVNQKDILKVHDTYTIITTTQSNINLTNNKEISGIITLTEKYDYFSKDMVKSKLENQFSIYQDTLINIGYTATLMVFKNPDYFTENPEKYINERINALEMYHRQKYLLKKLDIELDVLIRDLEKNFDDLDINNLKYKMDRIKKTQIDIQSKLEIYRNTRSLTTASFVIFFDIYNNVFHLDKHYKFVLEKLDACDNVYQGLHNQIRNELMEDIQVIVAILGILSLILLFIDISVDEYGIIQLILIPIFISIIWIFRKNILNFYNLLKKRILDSVYNKNKI